MDTETDKQVREQRIEKDIQYIVNEKEIDLPHHIYYLQVLNLYCRGAINDELIKNESLLLLEQAGGIQNEILVSDINEIKAARSFLLDQWNYFTWMN